MSESSVFLARLGLAPDADVRGIRRAYARELKKIDQENDLDGFQYLRDCYEAALAWAAHEASPVSGTDVQREHEAVQAIGAAVFASFRERVPVLATLPDRKSHADSLRIKPWIDALRDALADERLLRLDTMRAFEQHVAALLADGWQPGHHLLFPAAAEVFEWERDPGILESLGYPGMVLEQAFGERDLFQMQSILARTRQREVLSLLREQPPSGRHTTRKRVVVLRTLEAYFPTLLHVVAPREGVAAWRACHPDAMPATFVMDGEEPNRPWWHVNPSWVIFIVLVLYVMMMYQPIP